MKNFVLKAVLFIIVCFLSMMITPSLEAQQPTGSLSLVVNDYGKGISVQGGYEQSSIQVDFILPESDEELINIGMGVSFNLFRSVLWADLHNMIIMPNDNHARPNDPTILGHYTLNVGHTFNVWKDIRITPYFGYGLGVYYGEIPYQDDFATTKASKFGFEAQIDKVYFAVEKTRMDRFSNFIREIDNLTIKLGYRW